MGCLMGTPHVNSPQSGIRVDWYCQQGNQLVLDSAVLAPHLSTDSACGLPLITQGFESCIWMSLRASDFE